MPKSLGLEIDGSRLSARTALEKLAQAGLPEFPGPYRFAVTFQDEEQARQAALLPGAEALPDGRSAQIRAQDFEDGYRRSRRLIQLGGAAAAGASVWGAVGSGPEAAALGRKVADREYERFLERLPPVAPAAGTGRY